MRVKYNTFCCVREPCSTRDMIKYSLRRVLNISEGVGGDGLSKGPIPLHLKYMHCKP